MLYSIVGIIAVIIDQVVKYWVSKNIFGIAVIKFIPGIVSLVNVHNDGAAFSILSGANARIPFIVITVIFLVLVLIALATDFISGPFSRWCMVMIAAGGVGNCIDRVVNGWVQDMFKVELFNFPVFNVADIYITVFAILFVIAMLFERQPEDEDEEDEEEEPKARPEKRRAVREKPVREEEPRSLLGRRKPQDDEDDYEPAPVRRAPAKTAPAEPEAGRKAAPRKSSYEEDYARFKAQREAREQTEPRRAPAPVQPVNSDDPFAEWERASERVNARKAQPVQPEYEQRPEPEYREAERPAAPVRQPAPERQPAAKPAKVADDFDLDDILAEFK